MKKYVFKVYNPSFPTLFENEKKRILSHIDVAMPIEHVGSTAVPGLGGKGIIDIAIAASREDIEHVSQLLQEMGYVLQPKYSTPERLYFNADLPDPEEKTRRYHIHLTYQKSSEWKNFIAFRDRLRSHPAEAKEYGALKEKAAADANGEGEKYRKLKEPMIQKVLVNAKGHV